MRIGSKLDGTAADGSPTQVGGRFAGTAGKHIADESWRSVDSKTRGHNSRRKSEVAQRQSSRFDIQLDCEIVMMKAPEASGFLALSFVVRAKT